MLYARKASCGFERSRRRFSPNGIDFDKFTSKLFVPPVRWVLWPTVEALGKPAPSTQCTSPGDVHCVSFHADPAKPSQVRVMNIDRMVFEGDGLRVIGPPRTPQPMPSGAR